MKKEPIIIKDNRQRWREKHFQHKLKNDKALEKVHEKLGWFEPVEQ